MNHIYPTACNVIYNSIFISHVSPDAVIVGYATGSSIVARSIVHRYVSEGTVIKIREGDANLTVASGCRATREGNRKGGMEGKGG